MHILHAIQKDIETLRADLKAYLADHSQEKRNVKQFATKAGINRAVVKAFLREKNITTKSLQMIASTISDLGGGEDNEAA